MPVIDYTNSQNGYINNSTVYICADSVSINRFIRENNIQLERYDTQKPLYPVNYKYYDLDTDKWVESFGYRIIITKIYICSETGDNGSVMRPFIFSVKTDNTTTSETSETNQFTIPTDDNNIYNYDIVTSDGQTINGITGDVTITFPSAGTYDIEILGDFPNIEFEYRGINDACKITDIKQWGDNIWVHRLAFYDCSELLVTATDIPDFSKVTNMDYMFGSCSSLTTLDVSNWDVSSVISMYNMFNSCSSLTTLDVSNWDVSSVTSMSSMFSACSLLTTLDVSNWDVSSVTSMDYMFGWCRSLTTLNVSDWDISSCTNFSGFMVSSPGMTIPIYDQTLINWSAQSVSPEEAIDFGSSQYSEVGEVGWDILYGSPNYWMITDSGKYVA